MTADAPTPYDVMGGDAKVRALVDRFYDLMDLEPAYKELRQAAQSSGVSRSVRA